MQGTPSSYHGGMNEFKMFTLAEEEHGRRYSLRNFTEMATKNPNCPYFRTTISLWIKVQGISCVKMINCLTWFIQKADTRWRAQTKIATGMADLYKYSIYICADLEERVLAYFVLLLLCFSNTRPRSLFQQETLRPIWPKGPIYVGCYENKMDRGSSFIRPVLQDSFDMTLEVCGGKIASN